LIDVHAHFHTDDYVAAATDAGLVEPDGMPVWSKWSVAEHLAMMNDNGIHRAVLSVSSPGVHFGDDGFAAELASHVNDFASTVVDKHPDRFGFFASLALPAVDAAVAEAGRALDSLGAAGVIVMSNCSGQYLGDPALGPLWELLDQRRAICFIHPTSPPDADYLALGRPRPMIEFIFETTRTVTDMIFAGITASYPHIRFLIPHCGAALPLLAERIELFRSLLPGPDGRPPCPLTTQAQLQRFGMTWPVSPCPTRLAYWRARWAANESSTAATSAGRRLPLSRSRSRCSTATPALTGVPSRLRMRGSFSRRSRARRSRAKLVAADRIS
jgi:predicted TIM-barrel fold metal-dependent hydrolase